MASPEKEKLKKKNNILSELQCECLNILADDFTKEIDEFTDSESVRIATWNMRSCNEKLNNNSFFKAIFCNIVLKENIDLLCLQELLDEKILNEITQEMNKYSKNRNKWQSFTKNTKSKGYGGTEHYGLLYKTNIIWNTQQTPLINWNNKCGLMINKLNYKSKNNIFTRNFLRIEIKVNKIAK